MRKTARTFVGLAAVGALVMSMAGTASAVSRAVPTKVDPIIAAAAIANAYMRPPTKINQTVKLKTKAPTGKSIIFVQNGLAGTVLQQAGTEAAAKVLGWNFQAINFNPADPADLQKAMMNALALKPSAVIIAGVNPDIIGSSVLSAFGDAQTPIIVNSQCPLFAKPPLFKGANLCSGENAMGKVFANWFIADSMGKGKALFENIPAIPALTAFVDAFRTEVASKCATCQVDVYSATLAQVSSNQLIPALVNKVRTDPSYGYVFLDNAQWGSAALVSQLNAAGLGTVKVGGRSADANAIAGLQAGNQAAWTATPYPIAGMAAVDSALRIFTNSSGIDNNAIPPFQILTHANAASVAIPYNLPANGLQQYMRIWGR